LVTSPAAFEDTHLLDLFPAACGGLGAFKVSWIIVLCLLPLPELASFASKSTQAFCSLGTCTNSNAAKISFKSMTYFRFATIWGSLAWYLPVTCPVTSSESLFTNKLRAPIYLANNIPATKASFSLVIASLESEL